MVAVLDELGLTSLVCTIPGLSAVGAAAIPAETGDLRRFTSRAVVNHAGLAPRERLSGTFTGKARLTGAVSERGGTSCPSSSCPHWNQLSDVTAQEIRSSRPYDSG